MANKINNIRFMNLSMGNKQKREPYVKAFKKVLKSGIFIMGNEVEEFEHNIANYCDIPYAVGVASGTDALILALKAYEIQAGDEVIIPDMSFVATANAVHFVGAKIVFCDVEDDFNINTKNLKQLITSKTKAIIPVHYGGKMAKIFEIMKIAKKYNLKVIEDASQSFGAKRENQMAGTVGHIGCFSLNPMKPLGALGEAGLIITSSKEIYIKLKALRYNGLNDSKQCIYRSLNAKIDTIQASFLNIKLKQFDSTIKKRKQFVKYYNKNLKDYVIVPEINKKNKDVFFAYTILVEPSLRDKLFNYLLFNNIEAKINHLSMHQEPAYKDIKSSGLDNSKRLSKMKLSLPCNENLKLNDIKYIVKIIKEFFNEM